MSSLFPLPRKLASSDGASWRGAGRGGRTDRSSSEPRARRSIPNPSVTYSLDLHWYEPPLLSCFQGPLLPENSAPRDPTCLPATPFVHQNTRAGLACGVGCGSDRPAHRGLGHGGWKTRERANLGIAPSLEGRTDAMADSSWPDRASCVRWGWPSVEFVFRLLHAQTFCSMQ